MWCCSSSGSRTRTWAPVGVARATGPSSRTRSSWEVALLSDTTETPALASDTLRESIVDSLRSTLGDRLVDVKLVPNVDLWVRVGTEAWREAGLALDRKSVV